MLLGSFVSGQPKNLITYEPANDNDKHTFYHKIPQGPNSNVYS
jgi:hypothetical protein